MRFFVYVFLISSNLLLPSSIGAQGTVESSEGEDEMVSDAGGGEKGLFASFKVLRDDILKKLKTEIEPNLIAADAKRLTRNVMRLGSYRADWSKQAEEFLVANSPLAELFLYKYSLVGNSRLNQRILDTLLKFPSYREPRAALAFMEFFGDSVEQKIKVLGLVGGVARLHPEILNDLEPFLRTDWARELPLVEKLGFILSYCQSGRKPEGSIGLLADEWKGRASTLWESVSAFEVNSCLGRGA